MQAFRITELVIINHFTPRHQVRTSADRIVTLEAIGSVGLYLTADKTIGMLLGIEIVQCTLEREEACTISCKH